MLQIPPKHATFEMYYLHSGSRYLDQLKPSKIGGLVVIQCIKTSSCSPTQPRRYRRPY